MQLRTDPRTAQPASGSDFDRFFSEHRSGLFGALWLVTRDRHEAEELTQEAFVKVWEQWNKVRELADPTGYLYRTGMNLFRNRRRRVALAVRRAVRLAPQPGDEMRAIDDRDAIVRALGRLTSSQRAALVLVDLVGLTSQEAGQALGVRPSTVRVLAARGRTTLRREIGGFDGSS
ncbi:MAG TPA: sigma-70 family RNA polymerase sigma factor [Actinomycetota bacterium]|nr:sigma-70 family RNA polymerase sigma factor [Actinomycetota bacterium]